MKHSSEIMEDLGHGPMVTPSSSAPSQPTQPSSDELEIRTANFVVAMIRIFRQAWVSTYGETDDGTWRAVVAKLDRQEVRRGLELCHGHWEDSFPPRPGQFIKMARIPASQRVFDPSRALPSLPAQEHVREENLRKMRELVE